MFTFGGRQIFPRLLADRSLFSTIHPSPTSPIKNIHYYTTLIIYIFILIILSEGMLNTLPV